jgi:hypothetical protein
MFDRIAQPVHIDRADLFDQYPSPLSSHHELWAERSRPGTLRCRRDEDDRPGQQRICLDDHPETATPLLVPHALPES